MSPPKLVAMVVMLVFCSTTIGLGGGLIKAFKDGNKDNEKKIGISFGTFLCLTIVAYMIMKMIP
jgi:hypothetical protein